MKEFLKQNHFSLFLAGVVSLVGGVIIGESTIGWILLAISFLQSTAAIIGISMDDKEQK